jgi:hypothetical protein
LARRCEVSIVSNELVPVVQDLGRQHAGYGVRAQPNIRTSSRDEQRLARRRIQSGRREGLLKDSDTQRCAGARRTVGHQPDVLRNRVSSYARHNP